MKRILNSFILISIIISVSVVYMIGSSLIQRVNHEQFPTPKKAIEVTLKSNGNSILGTFYKGEKEKPIIALFHPLGGSQRSMSSRALFLQEQGYSVMTIDFNAHGKSMGEYNTFGYLESKNVQEVFRYLVQKFPEKKIGAIGVSLGGASILLSGVEFDAVVIEGTYADITTAIENRLSMQLGEWAKSFSWMLTMQLPLRLGIDAEDLRPEIAIQTIKSPTFIIAGEIDKRATLEESMRLYHAIPPKIEKELWVIKGAHHTNFHFFAKRRYEKRILDFFAKHL
jgi:esterase/lipase